MSNTNENLVFYWHLDEISAENGQRKIIDVSGKSNDGEIKGNPTIVIDEKFGSSLNFNGSTDYINITKPPSIDGKSFTLEAWIQPNNLNQRMGIISYGNLETAKGAWFFVNDQGKVQFDLSNQAGPASQEVVNDGKWHHAAVISKNGEIQIYVDGKPSGSPNTKDPQISNQEAVIGRGLTTYSSPFWFNGKLANVRIYNKALSPEEIKGDMNDDLSAIASFNKTHPLDFNLYEGDDKEPVIFIENGTKGQELVLEICNNTDQPITLASKSGNATKDNYHFELRFRPDTLSPTSLQKLSLVTSEDWQMSSAVTQADGTVSLYFLTTNSQALGANATATLTIQNINGASEGGARTTRVEFLCPQFTYEGETLNNYYREKSLSIINHRGKKNIPLHLTFIGSNRILNDGQQQTLILQIYNVLKDKSIDFNPKTSDTPSRFILYFDVDTDWGLGDKSQLENITVEVADWQPGKQPKKDWYIHPEKQAQPTVPIEGLSAPYWVLTHQNVTEPGLIAGHTIQITLKIPASTDLLNKPAFSKSLGQTNLYLRYENIPGYWDGTFVCTIEKYPIIFDTNGNVGIGTSQPGAKLDVAGNLRVGGGEFAGGNSWGRQIILAGPDPSASHVIRTRHSSGLGSGNAIDFYVWDAGKPSKDGIGTLQTMTLDSGKVGIGTGINGLNNKLEVKGNAVIGSTYAGTRTAPADDLLVEGTITAKKFVGEGAFVTGMIIMWSGSIDSIPTGWALCDGQNSTPDLRDRFILGTVDNIQGDQKGGDSSHTHSMSNAGNHSHNFYDAGYDNAAITINTPAGRTAIGTAGDHNHTINSASNLPPYYKMAFIMKT